MQTTIKETETLPLMGKPFSHYKFDTMTLEEVEQRVNTSWFRAQGYETFLLHRPTKTVYMVQSEKPKTVSTTAKKTTYAVSSTAKPIVQDDGKLPLTEQNKIKWEMKVDGKYIGTYTLTADKNDLDAVQAIMSRCPQKLIDQMSDAPFIELTGKTVGRRAHLAPVGLVEVKEFKWQVGK